MYKKKAILKIEKKYNSYQNTGAVGTMMEVCHKGLEDTRYLKKIKNNCKVLEIGAGTSPHLKYVKHKFGKYYFIETSKFAINFLKKKFGDDKKFKFKTYNGRKIPYKKNYFDRIIISHVLEHISDPEFFLEEMMSKLKKNGFISIALPNDPGFLWRLGRFFLKIFKVKKKLNITNLEYDYMIATEHVNSIFNLISIIRYKHKNNIISEKYLPFKIKILDLNLFYNVTLKK
ncbi:MAG: SAM-dependent methyltransferase [Candidatus Pelagibacterales bacterium]|nr:MAG: SAM-dependent methyltransferase [Pelagibacterales bacterium]